MDVEQLAVLRELAERGSVTAVAAATSRSPSAVSQQLKNLERSVGVVLVERVGRGVRLTDAGRALAASSVGIATAIAEAEATWQAFRGGATGVVRLAVFPSAAELLVPGLLTRMRAHGGIRLEVSDHDVSEDAFAELTADVDLVIAHRSDGVVPGNRAGLTVVPLLREPLDVAIPHGHPLADRERVSVAEVIGEDWVGVPVGFPLDRVLLTMALHAAVPANVVYRAIHLPLLENLVAAGHGLALLPRYTSRSRAQGQFTLAVLENLRAGRHLEALMRPDRAARLAVRTVLDEIRAEASAVA